jgi:hypothetical protein
MEYSVVKQPTLQTIKQNLFLNKYSLSVLAVIQFVVLYFNWWSRVLLIWSAFSARFWELNDHKNSDVINNKLWSLI